LCYKKTTQETIAKRRKFAQRNNRPNDENSPNLVTLLANNKGFSKWHPAASEELTRSNFSAIHQTLTPLRGKK
jgi:hypothetical protein